ncbi:MAG: hypothetical protein ACI9R3_005543 [Verrucomicrobiales bacterium]
MLSDSTQSDAFRRSEHWKSPLLDFQLRVKQEGFRGVLTGNGGPAYRSNSFSGNERNRLLLATGGGFVDRSLISGVDCKEDARSFALLDYDRDGWIDIALASANAPRLRLFRNRVGDLGGGGRVVNVRLIGGNTNAIPSTKSNRDACGAVLTAVTSNGKHVYRRSIGEGLSSQNAGAIRITLAPGDTLQNVIVHWPSGAVSNRVVEAATDAILLSE